MIRVLLVDDDPLVRSGLRLLLQGVPDLQIAGECDDGDGVAAAVAEHRPDVVLLDIRMPRVDGVTALRRLREAEGESVPAVVMLTTIGGEAIVMDALRAGAAGFLLKHTPPSEIVEAVRAAAAGDPAVSPDVLRQLIDRVARDEPPGAGGAPGLDALTDRERDVAFAVADGLGNAEIAKRLHFSTGTVKAHISSALAKLGVDNRTQLAIAAHEARRRGV